MANNTISNDDKFRVSRRDRMQDMVMSYAQLAIKSYLVICGGALVSIGVAFVSFISFDNISNKESASLIKETLSVGFENFSFCLSLILLSLLLIYLARVCFMIGSDYYSYSKSIRSRHDIYGSILETLCLIIYIYVLYKIITTFMLISTAYHNYSF